MPLSNNMGDEGYDDDVSNAVYYTIYILWPPPQIEHGDAFLDDVQLPVLLLRRAPQPPQLRTLLIIPLCHIILQLMAMQAGRRD